VIVASTCYDSVTEILADYASKITGPDVEQVPKVTAEALQRALAGHTKSRILCFFGHGDFKRPYFRSQRKRELLTPKTLARLRGWIVYGACCFSLCGAADDLVAKGATVIGFGDELQIPLPEILPHYIEPVRTCLTAIPKAFQAGRDAAAAADHARDVFDAEVSQLFARANTPEKQLQAAFMKIHNVDPFGMRP
jgi:hypothetical protein